MSIILAALAASAFADSALEEIVVTSGRQSASILDTAQSISRIDSGRIVDLAAQHYSAVINEAAGVYAQRNSGQESLLAIRSPVLTGAGACGDFLFLEDGFTLRPPGFCNVNELFELNTEQAYAIEIARGPNSALYGANALHGAIQVIGPEPEQLPALDTSLETGSNDYWRARVAGRMAPDWGGYLLATHDGGFRFHSDTNEVKGNLRYQGGLGAGTLRANAAVSDLDQNTASFIQGFDAYRSSSLRESNPNPEAYRRARSARANANWDLQLGGEQSFSAGAIVRWSQMNFLQHFLLGEPKERNGQRSAGMQLQWRGGSERLRLAVGFDADVSHSYLIEFQQDATTGAAPAAIAIRPPGFHYDYDVNTVAAGIFARAEWILGSRWLATAALRGDRIHYHYDNRMIDGNTNDQGVACAGGGCLYSRPADRSDAFEAASPQVSLLYRLRSDTSVYATASRGFRPPESTELYRLQKQQSIADLQNERLQMAEVGIRKRSTRFDFSAAGYIGRKTHYIFRDVNGFNVSDGITRHRGVEVEAAWRPSDAWSLDANASLARHTYDFDRSADQGERIVSGNEVDTSPHQLYSAALTRHLFSSLDLALNWTHVGEYFLDAANTASYPGHDVFDTRISWRVAPNWSATLRVDNVFDRAYADRADFAFGNYRYLPGRDRSFFVELRYRAE